MAPSPIRFAPVHSSVFLPLWAGPSLNMHPELMLVVLTKQWEGHRHPAGSPRPPLPNISTHLSHYCPRFISIRLPPSELEYFPFHFGLEL